MTPEFVMKLHHVSFSYSTRMGMLGRFQKTVLKDINLELIQGETLGILGRNGSGKSTLLLLMANIIEPTQGQIICARQLKRSLLTLGLGFRPDLTGRDNACVSLVLQGFPKHQAIELLDDINAFAELAEYFDQPVKSYSSGMRARLGFATAVYAEVDILLIDETLSVGDLAFRQKAEVMMQQKIQNSTVVFVSHASHQISKLCDRVIWLKDHCIYKIGNPKDIVAGYERSSTLLAL